MTTRVSRGWCFFSEYERKIYQHIFLEMIVKNSRDLVQHYKILIRRRIISSRRACPHYPRSALQGDTVSRLSVAFPWSDGKNEQEI